MTFPGDPSCRPCTTDADCGDSNPVTTDKCVVASGKTMGKCQYTASGVTKCTPGNSPVECGDGIACTTDNCNQDGSCSHTFGANCPCAKDSDCNDKNSCTSDTCNTGTGKCVFTPATGCKECMKLEDCGGALSRVTSPISSSGADCAANSCVKNVGDVVGKCATTLQPACVPCNSPTNWPACSYWSSCWVCDPTGTGKYECGPDPKVAGCPTGLPWPPPAQPPTPLCSSNADCKDYAGGTCATGGFCVYTLGGGNSVISVKVPAAGKVHLWVANKELTGVGSAGTILNFQVSSADLCAWGFDVNIEDGSNKWWGCDLPSQSKSSTDLRLGGVGSNSNLLCVGTAAACGPSKCYLLTSDPTACGGKGGEGNIKCPKTALGCP
ncbi:hypothetical protein EPN28_04600 [Patescibacteria group bacterium]|nr:MAG: hypothetical protein EPN28_04600 [Patescibacteria group bacterium]